MRISEIYDGIGKKFLIISILFLIAYAIAMFLVHEENKNLIILASLAAGFGWSSALISFRRDTLRSKEEKARDECKLAKYKIK